MKTIVKLSIIGTILLASTMAKASSTLTSVDGVWSNPVGGTNITYNNGVSVGYGNGSGNGSGNGFGFGSGFDSGFGDGCGDG